MFIFFIKAILSTIILLYIYKFTILIFLPLYLGATWCVHRIGLKEGRLAYYSNLILVYTFMLIPNIIICFLSAPSTPF